MFKYTKMVKASKVKQRRKAFEQMQNNEAEHDKNDLQNISQGTDGEAMSSNINSDNKYSKQNYKSRRRLMRLQKAMRLTSAL